MQMSKTWMMSAVAAVAVSSSVNAAFVATALDAFGTDSSAGLQVNATQTGDSLSLASWNNWGSITGTKTIGGAAPFMTGQPAQTYVFATAVQSGGTVTMAINTAPNAGTIGIGLNGNLNVRYRYSGTFDLSDKGDAFYFDGLVDAPSNGKWTIQARSGGTRYSAIISDVGTQVNGRWHVNFDQLTNGATAWTSGYNNITEVSVGLTLSANIVNSSTSASMGEFGIIPAPGAVALLGAAGLIGGARRRR